MIDKKTEKSQNQKHSRNSDNEYFRSLKAEKKKEMTFMYLYIYMLVYTLLSWGVFSATVIVVGHGIGDMSSNPGLGCLSFTSC